MTHFIFIAASYGVSLLGLVLLTGWMVVAYRGQRRALADLEARGIRRRARMAGTEPVRSS
ncbi:MULTISPECIES: heme exporter protein CcmD [unclassified Xanthobacter]|uniref:heme exporter protein CcmD n=1 Tax=unclassified Xanthobacter TaxID=2623496 RepID=UPI001EDE8196|nr:MULTISPECIES: heme exporter protein CcmD [unclassified Xanthobacter]